MHRRTVRLVVAACAAMLALAACTGSPEVVDAPTEPGAGCQAPALPPPPAGSEVLHEDCITITVAAGEAYWFDGDQALQQQNIPAPACPAFGSSFSWQVTSAGQPSVTLFIAPQGDVQPGESGASGTINGYCGTVAVEHTESTPVAIDLRYLLVDDCPDC